MKYPQQTDLSGQYVRCRIDEFVLEDAPQGDLTSNGIFASDTSITASIKSQEELVFAGEPLIANCFGKTEIVQIHCSDGQVVKADQIIAEIRGNAGAILTRERVLLNLLQRLCGIATEVRRYVKIAKPYGVKILDTRKTTPGLRLFEKYAVTVGGGFNHRLDLSSGILIKDNHIKAAGGITPAVEKIRSKDYGLFIEVEVETIDEIWEAMKCRIQGLLLDNMTPQETRNAVEIIRAHSRPEIFIEASGGITLDSLREYVVTGIDAISVGSLTHSVRSSNMHMEFDHA